ncbi:hypothetical protein BMUNKI379_21710, partial [Burkholderia multivorans]
ARAPQPVVERAPQRVEPVVVRPSAPVPPSSAVPPAPSRPGSSSGTVAPSRPGSSSGTVAFDERPPTQD